MKIMDVVDRGSEVHWEGTTDRHVIDTVGRKLSCHSNLIAVIAQIHTLEDRLSQTLESLCPMKSS